jgi:hypothetical protein
MDNSSDGGAYDDNGSACTTATKIGVVGGLKNNACSSPTPVQGIAHFSDPLKAMAEPTVGAIPQTCVKGNVGKITGGTATLDPGTYCGGIQITGSGAIVTFHAGLYILYGGGLQVASSATINGTGVTFYNTGEANGPNAYTPIAINGVSNSTLSAPTVSSGGAIAGVLFFDDRTPAGGGNLANKITGGTSTNFVGALYFPSTQLQYAGGTNAAAYTIIVADQLSFVGNTIINDTYTTLPGGHSLVQTANLAE